MGIHMNVIWQPAKKATRLEHCAGRVRGSQVLPRLTDGVSLKMTRE